MKILTISNYNVNNNHNKMRNSNVSFGFVGGPGRTLNDNAKISEKFNKEVGKAIKKVGKFIKNLFK